MYVLRFGAREGIGSVAIGAMDVSIVTQIATQVEQVEYGFAAGCRPKVVLRV